MSSTLHLSLDRINGIVLICVYAGGMVDCLPFFFLTDLNRILYELLWQAVRSTIKKELVFPVIGEVIVRHSDFIFVAGSSY